MALFKEVMPDLEFGHFNILEDEEVRQGIKRNHHILSPTNKKLHFRIF